MYNCRKAGAAELFRADHVMVSQNHCCCCCWRRTNACHVSYAYVPWKLYELSFPSSSFSSSCASYDQLPGPFPAGGIHVAGRGMDALLQGRVHMGQAQPEEKDVDLVSCMGWLWDDPCQVDRQGFDQVGTVGWAWLDRQGWAWLDRQGLHTEDSWD